MDKKTSVPRTASKGVPRSSGFNASLIASAGIAVVVHVLIALAVGSYVVFEGIVPVPFFHSDSIDAGVQSAMMEEVPLLIEEEALPDVAVAEVQTVQEEAGGSEGGPDMSDLITVSTSTLAPSFSMPTTVGNPNLLQGNLFSGGSGRGSGSGQGAGSGKVLKSLFGSSAVTEGLIGYIYDLRRQADGTEIKGQSASVANPIFVEIVEDLLTSDGGIHPRKIENYYRAPYALGSALFLIPGGKSTDGPHAFGMETLPGHQMWIAHYKGAVRAPKPGKYRFVGSADEILIVRVNGKVVLDGTWRRGMPWKKGNPTGWESSTPLYGAGDAMRVGDWFDAGTAPLEMEIMLGEGWGGQFNSELGIEEAGVNYEGKPRPVFKTTGYEDMLQPAHEKLIQARKLTLEGPTFQTRF